MTVVQQRTSNGYEFIFLKLKVYDRMTNNYRERTNSKEWLRKYDKEYSNEEEEMRYIEGK